MRYMILPLNVAVMLAVWTAKATVGDTPFQCGEGFILG